MGKRILSVAMVVVMLLLLPSCTVIYTTLGGFLTQDAAGEQKADLRCIETFDYHISNAYEYSQFKYGYEALEDGEEQRLYNNISYAVNNIAQTQGDNFCYPISEIYSNTQVSDVQFMKVMTAFSNDYPQVFWLTNSFDYYDIGSKRVFQMYSYLSFDKCSKAQKKFYEKVKEIVTVVPEELNEFEREQFLHDYMIENCEYLTEDSWLRYSPYGALVQGKAMCEGYTEALQILFNCVGVESTVLVGESGEEAHEWNVVRIDGEWYHLDATWNDLDKENVKEFEKYCYFNVDDSFIASDDRKISPLYELMPEDEIANYGGEYMELFNLFIPVCGSMESNYFYKNAAFLTNINTAIETQPLERLIAAAKNKEPYYYIMTNQDINSDELYNKLFDDDNYYSYVKAANQSKDNGGNKIKDNAVTTYTLDGYDNLLIAKMVYN